VNLPSIDELIGATMQPTEFPDLYECVCGASTGGDLSDDWAELLCPECLDDLFDRLNPTLTDDDDARDGWHLLVVRMVGSR